MSTQEQRSAIIQECIPELVRQLTGFQDDDENMERCIQFGWNIIRNHRNLSTSSHDVRRRIEGIQERFRAENCPEYADYLGRLCEEIVKHPLCVNHYEVDVHWSLLDFLFTLAYNPTSALRKNKHKIEIKPATTEESNEDDHEKEYWKNVLKEEFTPVASNYASDSELSDWSDHEENVSGVNNLLTAVRNLNLEKPKSSTSRNPSICGELKPPEKYVPFKKFDVNNAEEILLNSVQHSWWNADTEEHRNVSIESTHRDANFAINYNKFLSETSNNLIPFTVPTTISENHVMREILWMFHVPVDCTVFTFGEDNKLKIKDNVTIPSCSVNSFKSFLQTNFLPYIHMMETIRNFHNSIYSCEDRTPPCTLECYAANLNLHLAPIWEELLSYEKRLINQEDFVINTLINMHSTLKKAFGHLESLFECHQQVVLNWCEYPSHISAAYLLTSLMRCYKMEINVSKGNIYMSLLLSSIKVFCEIIDTWWTQGRLDDWQQEYIVERVSNVDHTICMREFGKDVPTHVTKMIEDNSLFHLIKEHSLEAGHTLNLLYEIKRISDLRYNCDAMQGKLYDVFIDDFLKEVKIMQVEVEKEFKAYNVDKDCSEDNGIRNDAVTNAVNSHSISNDLTIKDNVHNGSRDEVATNTIQSKDVHSMLNDLTTQDNEYKSFCNEGATNTVQSKDNHSILNDLTTEDDFLRTAFTLNMSQEDLTGVPHIAGDWQYKAEDKDKQVINVCTIYELLQKSEVYLPLEDVLIKTLSKILKVRIAFANCFVMRLYREDFMILKHLQNIRKIFLMEASDLMHQFYSKLFQQIESGEDWANPSLLTMQLDDIICAKFPEMSSLFLVEINSAFRCQTTKVVEAADEIVVTYNLSRELAHIVSADDLQLYNKVFCFLLKVKWGITTLEKLQFARNHKKRIPYAKFEMIDLIMRRLEQLRFWMMYALQSIHFHLMTHVLQSMGEQLDVKIDKCANLKEIELVHKSYLSTVCEHCFLTETDRNIKAGVEQLLSLVSILRDEWLSCVKYIENNGPLAIDLDDSTDSDFVANSQIDEMEYTYICCHQYLAKALNDQVYMQKKTFLSGLRAAFNTSVPH